MTDTPRTDWRVWQDARVADRFADRRPGVFGAAAQFTTMLRLLREVPAEAPTVLDLGCGDGVLLETVLEERPAARGVGLDGSPAMIERARQRFARPPVGGRARFVLADFSSPHWRAALPPGAASFDVVVSGFTIHHLEDDQKRTLYADIFELLRPGGAFVNVEHVASAGPLGTRLFEESYANGVVAYCRSRGQRITLAQTVTPEQVLAEMRDSPEVAANRLSPVEAQLSWLRGIGFVEVDCYWKWYELAVLAGFKPA